MRRLAVPIVLALAGAAPAGAADLLSVTQYGVAATSLPWGVARDHGWLAAAGVDGIVGSNGGGTSVRNMMASGLPFAEVATSAGVAAFEAGLDVIFVYSSNNNTGDMGWVTLPQSPVRTIADLKGRKLGYTNPHSTTEMLLHMVLEKAGLADKVSYLATGGIAAGRTILAQGLIDATPIDDPAFEPKDSFRVLFFVRDSIPNVTWTIGLTTRAFASAHPDTVRRLIAVHRRAVDFMRDHPAEAARTFAKDWQLDDALAAAMLKKFFALNYWSRGDFNMSGLKALVDGMAMVETLAKPVDLAKLVDKDYLPEDLR